MDFSDTQEEAAFRVEIRTWIDQNAPDYLFEPLSTSGFGSIQIGGFDPIFFMYGEDVNYTQRLRYHGYKVGITPLSKIYHSSENNYYKNEVFGSKKFIVKQINKFYTTYGNVNIRSNLGLFRYVFYVLRKGVFNFLVFQLSVGRTYFRIWRILSVQSAIKLKSRGRDMGPQHLKILE